MALQTRQSPLIDISKVWESSPAKTVTESTSGTQAGVHWSRLQNAKRDTFPHASGCKQFCCIFVSQHIFFMTSLSYMAMNKPVGELSQISSNEKIVKGSIYVLNGAVVEEIAAPIALVFAFPPAKTRDVQNPSSNVEKWEAFKKQFVLDMISAKIATPALNHLVGLQDGRICCYWDNKKNVSMNSNQ